MINVWFLKRNLKNKKFHEKALRIFRYIWKIQLENPSILLTVDLSREPHWALKKAPLPLLGLMGCFYNVWVKLAQKTYSSIYHWDLRWLINAFSFHLCLFSGVSLGEGTGATMSDDEEDLHIDFSLDHSASDSHDLMGFGPLLPTETERSLMERVRQELKIELKQVMTIIIFEQKNGFWNSSFMLYIYITTQWML